MSVKKVFALVVIAAIIGAGAIAFESRKGLPVAKPPATSVSSAPNLGDQLSAAGFVDDPLPVHPAGVREDEPESVRMGNTIVTIPAPDGFTRIGPDAKQLMDYANAFTAPQVRLCAFYLPADEAAKKSVNFTRQTSITITHINDSVLIPATYFPYFRTNCRAQMAEAFEKVQKQIPGILDAVNKNLSAQGIDFKAFGNSMVTLAVHEETENAVAFSGYVEMKVENGGVPGSVVSAKTIAFIVVRQKMFMLGAVGRSDDLSWSRSTISQWIKAITDANRP
jgi:hypothetical protein